MSMGRGSMTMARVVWGAVRVIRQPPETREAKEEESG